MVGRQVEKLVPLKNLHWVRHNVAPRLLLKLIQEELLGSEPEADGVGAVQLSSQPLREREIKTQNPIQFPPAGNTG